MNKTLSQVPWWAWAILLIVVGYLLYKAYIYVTVTLPQSKNYTATVKNAQTELSNLASQGISPSYPQATFNGMANDLQQTFTGCGLDWTGVVVPTFQQMKNQADVYALISTYGVRTFDECGWGSFTGDLASAISYKTSGIILTATLNPFTDASIASINAILKQNGLTFPVA